MLSSRLFTISTFYKSIFESILFAFFINGLPKRLFHWKMHMYADKVQVYRSCPVQCLMKNIARPNYDYLTKFLIGRLEKDFG